MTRALIMILDLTFIIARVAAVLSKKIDYLTILA